MDPFSLLASKTLPVIIDVLKHFDKEAWDLLRPHANKTICFQIEHFSPLYFEIEENGLKSIEIKDEHIDTTFSGPLSAFIAMIFTKNRIQHGLHIKGDLDCAKALYDTWHFLDLDFEGHLAKIVGKNFAHLISHSLSQSQTWLKATVEARKEDLGAYLQDEAKLLPTRLEIEDFFNQIDTLRHDVDRFEAKLRLFQSRLRE